MVFFSFFLSFFLSFFQKKKKTTTTLSPSLLCCFCVCTLRRCELYQKVPAQNLHDNRTIDSIVQFPNNWHQWKVNIISRHCLSLRNYLIYCYTDNENERAWWRRIIIYASKCKQLYAVAYYNVSLSHNSA